MSIFATIATVCTMTACNVYNVDTSTDYQDAQINTYNAENAFLNIWGDEQDLTKWLDKYKIGETVFEIVSVDFDTEEQHEDDTP